MSRMQFVIHKTFHWMTLSSSKSASVLKGLLMPFSLLYALGIKGRNFCYNEGFFKSKKVPAFVISVGNVEVGGTGKTPWVLFLASELIKYYRIAIILRGYKALIEKHKHPMVVCEGKGPLISSSICGDEAYMLAEALPTSLVIAGADREKGAFLATEKGAQIILLDDGMQHRRLHRDIDIAVVTPALLEKKEKYLPAGRLRDEKNRIYDADFLVIHGNITQPLSKLPLFVQVETFPKEVVSLINKEKLDIKGKKVALFCGIGQPDRFVKTVMSLGAQIVFYKFFEDHADFSTLSLSHIVSQAQQQGAKFVLCTEKDRVKLFPSQWENEYAIPVGVVKTEMKMLNNEASWNVLMQHIKEKVGT